MLLSYDGWQFFHTRNMGWTCTIYILDYVVAVSLKSVLILQSCRTLCKLTDCSLPGSSAYGMLQARIMEWVVIPFSRGPSWPRDWTQVFCIAGKFFTTWAIREASIYLNSMLKCCVIWGSKWTFPYHFWFNKYIMNIYPVKTIFQALNETVVNEMPFVDFIF